MKDSFLSLSDRKESFMALGFSLGGAGGGSRDHPRQHRGHGRYQNRKPPGSHIALLAVNAG
jgi:hypothetical protein